ncbi:TetR/AcrR family transcriptional regulator [Spongiactinospora rosea]|uniref:TetR/AcrR family transcriptional regulator n=1 Tax=Spongiactinospora rosea TaxID=2248750 RepID=A0A366LJZ1_9ACTN|nr:TetR/AcrR family transcriptional regulator [Spongiactinospora rosea]RBQ14225.1 TetR/AcrR family transcriptional regulator [Spongiactinospora rosea]
MRPSSRTTILEAAQRIAGRSGIGSLTLDAAAQEAGLSKGGLIYHFASKEQLMLAVVEYVTASWEERMLAQLGKPLAEAGVAERVRAYAVVVSGAATSRADLAIFVDSVYDEALMKPWQDMLRRWLGAPSAADTRSVDLAVARLAADGLWLADASDTSGYDAETRAAIIARIDRLATGKEDEE